MKELIQNWNEYVKYREAQNILWNKEHPNMPFPINENGINFKNFMYWLERIKNEKTKST